MVHTVCVTQTVSFTCACVSQMVHEWGTHRCTPDSYHLCHAITTIQHPPHLSAPQATLTALSGLNRVIFTGTAACSIPTQR